MMNKMVERNLERCAIIIQARMSSRRFPGKMMSRVSGLPLVHYLYKRCAGSSVKKIMVATSEDRSDDVLYDYCVKNNIPVVRGSLDNVLERYIKASDLAGAHYIARVCGDTPFFDLSLLELALETLIDEGLDYVSLDRLTCAAGFYSEALTVAALKKAAMMTDDKESLEHVTKYIIDNKDRFRTKFLNADLNPEFVKGLRLTVDYPEDIVSSGNILRNLKDGLSFTSAEVLEAARPSGCKKYTAGDFPGRVEIEIASACNLKCTYCPRRHLDKLDGFLSFSLFKKLIDETARYPETALVLHRRGESLLHPDFIDMCGYIQDKFRETQIATNATVLDEKRSRAIIDAIDFISFSIDTPAAFDRTRSPASYKKVEENILRFLDMNKGKVRTQVSMVETSDTPAGEREIFKKIWKGKVDRIRLYEEHSRNGAFGSLRRPRGVRMPCVMPFHELLIYCDGKAGRCNHDWNGAPMGDVNDMAIKEIWHSKRYDDLRKQHKTLAVEDEVCRNCDSWYPEIGIQGTGEAVG